MHSTMKSRVRVFGFSLILVAVVFASLFCRDAGADTYVSGSINDNKTWGLADSPYRLSGNVIVNKETYSDLNNNGQWDDLPEPFTDSNENGEYDPGEPFEDIYPNERWDPHEPFSDLNGNGVFDSPFTLTIASGVEVALNSYSLSTTTRISTNQRTTINASGVTFTDANNSYVSVGNYGELNLSNCTFSGGSVSYNNGSSGALDHCTGDAGWNLYLKSSGALIKNSTIDHIISPGGTSTVTGNTLTGYQPLRITDPDMDMCGVSGNTYTHSDPKISISGGVNGTSTLGFIDGLGKYYLDNVITVNSDATLTILSGVEIGPYYFSVSGTLNASGVAFTGTTNSTSRNFYNLLNV